MTVVIMQFAPAAFERENAAAYCGLSLSTFEKGVREKTIPQARQLSSKRVGWLRVELDAWLLSRPSSEMLPPANTGAKKPRMQLEHSTQ
ncbi:AlpA family phage regulatory protein [Lampropedia aestuarii]|uniref:AlpA family phage regulatory protein n=1 Tax=Lampropedia aestuarii TaxID=2562762 RepID=A0A4S5BKK3_9BURK|nr:AlpA family phage regulatory protein [Lampropedia aestuarii]THJ33044.1 AlpA family phage regulatory protein [Lampropedia aestuarii]